MKVIVTSSLEAEQGELIIVHLKTYVLPAVPVKVEVAELGVVILPPVPETILHVPVPTVGVFAARVVLVSPHKVAPI